MRSYSLLNPESAPSLPFINHLPLIRVIEHYAWTGRKHADLYPQIIDLLKNVWHCRKISVDSTGIGQPVASFLQQVLGSRVIPFVFTSPAKTELGFNLLAAVNAGRLKMYAGDTSEEYQEFWLEIEKAKSRYRQNRTMNFYVDPAEGHDDFLMNWLSLSRQEDNMNLERRKETVRSFLVPVRACSPFLFSLLPVC